MDKTLHTAKGIILAKANRTAIAEFLSDSTNPNSVYKKGSTVILDGICFPADAKHGDKGTLEYRHTERYGLWFFVKDEV